MKCPVNAMHALCYDHGELACVDCCVTLRGLRSLLNLPEPSVRSDVLLSGMPLINAAINQACGLSSWGPLGRRW
jgi:hypothetical protein